MQNDKINFSLIIPIGLMLFSFFFGAGNLIFPPVLGQMAGDNIGWGMLGFCLSGVGFPLLGVLAMAMKQSDNPDSIAMPIASPVCTRCYYSLRTSYRPAVRYSAYRCRFL